MKYTLFLLWMVLLLACGVLAVQAALSLKGAVLPGGDAETAEAGPNPESAVRQAARAGDRYESCDEFLQQLARTDLLDGRTGGLTSPQWKEPSKDAGKADDVAGEERELRQAMNQAADNWAASEQARKLVMEFAPVGRQLSETPDADDSVDQLDQSKQVFENFVGNHGNVAKVKGADRLVNLAKDAVKKIDGEISQIKRRQEAKDEMEIARKHFANHRYAECLAQLESNPLSLQTDVRTKREIERLRVQCEYRIRWQELSARHKKPARSQNADDLQAFNEFLDDYSQLPTGSPGEVKAHDIVVQWRDDLELKLALDLLGEVDEWETLLVRAVKIVENPRADSAVKGRAREKFRKWLTAKGFPRIEPPESLDGLQEGVTKSGLRFIGVFYQPPGTTGWRYWKTQESRDSLKFPGGEIPPSPIPNEQFSAPGFLPDTPKLVQWAEQYNEAVLKLLGKAAGERRWREFAAECDDLAKGLEGYQKTYGGRTEADKQCRDWPNVLRDRSALAAAIADRWEQVGTLLAAE